MVGREPELLVVCLIRFFDEIYSKESEEVSMRGFAKKLGVVVSSGCKRAGRPTISTPKSVTENRDTPAEI